ncbi:MAG TPA: acyltransferase family protein [Arenimonas sp.]|uniref:acyltransferase family protein n=1 Tax=Arenimonas sp. TaxID=1872635 RepID=UPI002B9F62B9|nr:acyltransferase family protein [Arenimonas sp.]HMB56916.1 acyltransferase family protein [Arenimonas sp.]
MTRRHDIDALRAIAFTLLILYHLCMLYVSDWGWHIKSPHQGEWLQWPMLFLNRWRMDLIFLISGIASAFLINPDKVWNFVRSRTWRLFLPLLFGMLVIVPIQPYVQGVSNHLVEPGFGQFLVHYYSGQRWPEHAFDGWEHGFTWNHLWYLAYLWMYTLALALLAKPLASRFGQRLTAAFTGLRGARLLIYPALPLLLYTLVLQPLFPDNGDFIHDWYRNAAYFTVFVYGYLIARSDGFWAEALRLRRVSLTIALLLFVPYISMVALLPEDSPIWLADVLWVLRNFYIWTALLAILGWAHALLNKPFRWLPWATESVYPWYIFHQSLIVLLAYWLIPLKFGPVLEPLLVLAGTIAGCYLLSEGAKRVSWLRPCLGLKSLPKIRKEPIALETGSAQA